MNSVARPILARPLLPSSLWDRRLSIGGPTFDALIFWGSPVIALAAVWTWAAVAAMLPPVAADRSVTLLGALIGILTYAHLIAAAPRAYLNKDVFAAHRARVLVAPILLVAALTLSPTLLIAATVLAVFWDVHHSAMQLFGLARIYDVKAGNDSKRLRATDLWLNWILYVGPIAVGASLGAHLSELGRFEGTALGFLVGGPGVAEAHAGPIRTLALAAWGIGLIGAGLAYAAERRRGYRMPAHKAALLVSAGATSMLAWALSPPFIAFAISNLFHAVQYFALVWLKEGARIGTAMRLPGHRLAPTAFFAACTVFGLAYWAASSLDRMMAPFIACSLLHFWYDSFIWSVRKRQV